MWKWGGVPRPVPPTLSLVPLAVQVVRTRTEGGGELLVGSMEPAEKLNSRVCGRNPAKGLN